MSCAVPGEMGGAAAGRGCSNPLRSACPCVGPHAAPPQALLAWSILLELILLALHWLVHCTARLEFQRVLFAEHWGPQHAQDAHAPTLTWQLATQASQVSLHRGAGAGTSTSTTSRAASVQDRRASARAMVDAAMADARHWVQIISSMWGAASFILVVLGCTAWLTFAPDEG